MGNSCEKLRQIDYKLDLNTSKSELYKCLHYLTNEDYNGDNGEEYYAIVETEDGEIKMPRLEQAFKYHYSDYDNLVDFIDFVIGDCYALDPYYSDFALSITKVYDTLVIVLSYVLSCNYE